MKQRIVSLLAALRQGVYEKDNEIAMGLLAALAGESLLLLGPPGVAKSMVARRLRLAFAEATAFEYLMSRFSTPDEIFGPVSIGQLRDSDAYIRQTQGYLPSADVVFLDEIWKAGPAIQNTLLTVLNEKIFLNGNQTLHLPLKLLIGASNELPAAGEGLEALWDRFLLRLLSAPIHEEDNFYKMLLEEEHPISLPAALPDAIRPEEYKAWQTSIKTIPLSKEVLQAITQVRQQLQTVTVQDDEAAHAIYVSDRRWKKIAHLMRTSAFLHDRESVSLADLLVAAPCLWNEPNEAEAVTRILVEAIYSPYVQQLNTLHQQISHDIAALHTHTAIEKAQARGDHRDDDAIVFDGQYYALAKTTATPATFIPVSDFKVLPSRNGDGASLHGILYHDPVYKERAFIRAYTNPDNTGIPDGVEGQRVHLCRDILGLYINGTRYAIRRAARGEALTQSSGYEPSKTADNDTEACEKAVDVLYQSATRLHATLRTHLFTSPSCVTLSAAKLDALRREVALLRADIRLLLYGE